METFGCRSDNRDGMIRAIYGETGGNLTDATGRRLGVRMPGPML